MNSMKIKPILIKPEEQDSICYELCNNHIFRNDFNKGIIISESGEFLDELFEYMNKIKIPHMYYSNATKSMNSGFILVDKHDASQILEHDVLESFDALACPKGYSLIYCVFDDELYSLTLKKECDYNKVDFSLSDIPLHLSNHEIKEVFLESFRVAEKEIDICSPWISKTVVNQQFIRLMREALYRNVTIKILYGLESSSDEYNIKRSKHSDDMAELLKKEFNDFYSRTFFIQRDNIHYKVVLCDDKFKLEGSYNYLSFDGEYPDNSVRKEGSPFGTNIDEIKLLRRKYFESIR